MGKYGDIIYNDGTVRLDSEHANEYVVMSDADTQKMFGIKNGFDNNKMITALNSEQKIWDKRFNSNAFSYHGKSFYPFFHQHNCNDFINATVRQYQKE